jgi:hypothetical protein
MRAKVRDIPLQIMGIIKNIKQISDRHKMKKLIPC